jgi:hypothetical protein
VRKVTRLSKDTRIKIAFRPENAIQYTLKHCTHTDKYSGSEIYQMKFLDYPLKYIGQAGRTFNVRYKEHINAISNNNRDSRYSNHMPSTYGNTITLAMDILIIGEKGKHSNALENYNNYKISSDNLLMNDTYNETINPIFQTLCELHAR